LSCGSYCLRNASAGHSKFGCGVYVNGAWAFSQWPEKWAEIKILSDITYLEMVPIALACCLWKEVLFTKINQFRSRPKYQRGVERI